MFLRLYCRMVAAFKSEEGATAVEYGLLVALIGVLLILAMTALKDAVKGAFNSATSAMGGTPAP